MARMIRDDDFRSWEVYATTGPHGFSRPARMIFHCVSDPGERPRYVDLEGDKSDAEERVAVLPDAELSKLLEAADPIG